MKEILDYSEFVVENAFAERGLYGGGQYINTHFFRTSENDNCPFCKIKTRNISNKSKDEKPNWLDGGDYLINESVWSCNSCGWWKVRTDKDTNGSIDAVSAEIKNGVLRRYDLSDKGTPIKLLQSYL